jgi:hypothetical protein
MWQGPRMIISPGRNYIFVHIPKTGGTSMALALEDRAMKDDVLIGDTPKAVKRRGRVKKLSASGRLWKHSTLADIDGVLSPNDIATMFCFTLVRNPWDRLVSYYHWLQGQTFDHPAVQLAKDLPFEAFCLHDMTAASFRANPAASYMTDVTGTVRATAYIRLEHLDQDMSPLADHLGFAPELPHVNASDRSGYRDYYTRQMRDSVAAFCAQDIAQFGYAF